MSLFFGNPVTIEDIPDGVHKCMCKDKCTCIAYHNQIKGYLLHAHQALTAEDSWKNFKIDYPKDEGFMFSNKRWIEDVANYPSVYQDGHSGGSFAITMRFMEYIGLNGWDLFVENWS